jgi:hypothetical protein
MESTLPRGVFITELKKRITIFLLVIGLLFLGGGFLLRSIYTPKINLPEGLPIVLEERHFLLGGEDTYLYVFENGSIMYIDIHMKNIYCIN